MIRFLCYFYFFVTSSSYFDILVRSIKPLVWFGLILLWKHCCCQHRHELVLLYRIRVGKDRPTSIPIRTGAKSFWNAPAIQNPDCTETRKTFCGSVDVGPRSTFGCRKHQYVFELWRQTTTNLNPSWGLPQRVISRLDQNYNKEDNIILKPTKSYLLINVKCGVKYLVL